MGDTKQEHADPEISMAINRAAKLHTMPRGFREPNRFAKVLEEIMTPPHVRPRRLAPEPISESRRAEIQADIDRIVAERRAQ